MARGARINYKVGADTSQFKRAMAGVKSTVRGLGTAVKSAVAPIAIMTGAVSALTGAIAAKGIRSVVKFGAELDHLKDQTGISVRELILLRQAFEDGGVSAESVGKTVSRMQAAISEGSRGIKTYTDAFGMLGVNVKDLEGMTVSQQFGAVAKAIANSGNAADKTNASLKIFGRSGAELAAVFNNFSGTSNPFEDIEGSIGTFATNMDKVSHLFERIDTLVGRMKLKFLAIFEPVATKFVEPMLQVLEKVDKTSFTKFGEAIADSLGKVFNAFKDGKIGEILQLSIVIGLKKGSAALQVIFKALISSLRSVFSEIIKLLPQGLQDVLQGLLAGMTKIVQAMIGVVAKLTGEEARIAASSVGIRIGARKGGFIEGRGENERLTPKGLDQLRSRIEQRTGEDVGDLQRMKPEQISQVLTQAVPNAPRSGNTGRDLASAFVRLRAEQVEGLPFLQVPSIQSASTQMGGVPFSVTMQQMKEAFQGAGSEETKRLTDTLKGLSTEIGTGELPAKPALKAGTGTSLLEDAATATGLAPIVSTLQAIGGGGGIGGLSSTETLLQQTAEETKRSNELLREQNDILRGQALPAIN
jgi:hypothetical protein